MVAFLEIARRAALIPDETGPKEHLMIGAESGWPVMQW
ncbi:MAG: hypothetical protein RJA44_1575 [Pseudomonadota bacterium]